MALWIVEHFQNKASVVKKKTQIQLSLLHCAIQIVYLISKSEKSVTFVKLWWCDQIVVMSRDGRSGKFAFLLNIDDEWETIVLTALKLLCTSLMNRYHAVHT